VRIASGFILIALVCLTTPAIAQVSAPSEKLLLTAQSSTTWTSGDSSIIQLQGGAKIELEHSTLTAKNAVIWLTPKKSADPDEQQVQVALIGDAKIEQQDVTRSGDSLFVSTTVRGTVRVTAEQRIARDSSDSDLYKTAAELRDSNSAPRPQGPAVQRPWAAAHPENGVRGEVAPPPEHPPAPVEFSAGDSTQTNNTPGGNVAFILSKGVILSQKRDNGDLIELWADNAVLFTQLKNLRDLDKSKFTRVEEAIDAVYLEGDVRIIFTPAKPKTAEQRLTGSRVYYEFGTDRAILTDAVIHTLEPQRQIPVVVRARTVRQLAVGEYDARKVELSTSGFATPSFSIAADKIYVRETDTGDPELGSRVTFYGTHATFEAFHLPFFYLPVIGGSVTEHGFPLRGILIDNSKRFGLGMQTEWGLFETIGEVPPHGLDISYDLAYFTDRGPALGLNGKYSGGFITETTKDPWNFTGSFRSYFVDDHGKDDLGRYIVDPGQEIRGHALWEHQHFFPGDWQVQLRAGYVSDATFLEEWRQSEFENGPPHDISAYFKRQRDTEAFTALFQFQPNNVVTTAELEQEQFEVERIPQFGYHRIGDSFADDNLTFFSDNSVSRLRFNTTSATLTDQGFERNGNPATFITPGIASLGTTGIDDDPTYRGDFRQEVDYPLGAGPFKLLPYVVGRYTPYSNSPTGGARDRLFTAAGLRISTAFWKVDNAAQSELFDIHRIRHVIEPELHLFASAQTTDRSDLFIYDEPIDAINDVQAVQLALRQRWQTKRGGPGAWRSVDFFTLNIEGNFFANKPTEPVFDPINGPRLRPSSFRGLFFPSLPETSQPRNSINTDATWRISDTTAILADAEYNTDASVLSTAAIGIAVRHDPRVTYYVGTRYIEALNSNITTFAVNYELSRKYALAFEQSFDFGQREDVSSSITVIRHFDRFFASFRIYYDSTNDEKGFSVNILPEGLAGPAVSGLQSAFVH
jgi:hypothetical protein